MRRGRKRRSAVEHRAAQEFHARVCARDGRCAMCGGPAQVGHHVLRRQVLERVVPERAWDPTIGIALCHDCHSSLHGLNPRKLPERCIPARIHEFAAEHGLHFELERATHWRARVPLAGSVQ